MHPYLIICELCELCEQMCRLSIFSGKCLYFQEKIYEIILKFAYIKKCLYLCSRKINNIPETTNMNEVYFAKQDAFTAELIAAFDSGQLPPIVKPYIDWKRGLADLPSRQAAYEILDAIEAIDEPSEHLLAISDELSTIINILK